MPCNSCQQSVMLPFSKIFILGTEVWFVHSVVSCFLNYEHLLVHSKYKNPAIQQSKSLTLRQRNIHVAL